MTPTDRLSHRAPTNFVGSILYRIRAEFLEMPDLNLTSEQAARLWHLDRDTCEAVLDALVVDHFLHCTPRGAYVRADHR